MRFVLTVELIMFPSNDVPGLHCPTVLVTKSKTIMLGMRARSLVVQLRDDEEKIIISKSGAGAAQINEIVRVAENPQRSLCVTGHTAAADGAQSSLHHR